MTSLVSAQPATVGRELAGLGVLFLAVLFVTFMIFVLVVCHSEFSYFYGISPSSYELKIVKSSMTLDTSFFLNSPPHYPIKSQQLYY